MQHEENQEESEQNEVDVIKEKDASTGDARQKERRLVICASNASSCYYHKCSALPLLLYQ